MASSQDRAIATLRRNDRGSYTVPTSSGLYPAQWNWDSCFVALGFATFDTDRAWVEIETLLDGQWPSGMVPHILFHGDDSTYFPNADVWRAGPARRSSGITQPPVAATAVRLLYERCGSQSLGRVRELAPKLLASHRWFARARDPQASGLVAIIHPWESGMDNSPIWDEALAAVAPGPSVADLRKDTSFASASVRPTGPEYDRYINLVLKFREHEYRDDLLFAISPFLVADVGFNAILMRAAYDLRFLLELAGDEAGAREVALQIARTSAALERCWNAAENFYFGRNVRAGTVIREAGIAGFLPLFADDTVAAQHPQLVARLEQWLDGVKFGVPSFDPKSPKFEAQRYWRGPVWIVVNWMLADGLRRNGLESLARRIECMSLDLIERTGFAEYFDPLTGDGLGGPGFSWTAAMYLHMSSTWA